MTAETKDATCGKCGHPQGHFYHDGARWPGRLTTGSPYHAYVPRDRMTLDDLTSYRPPTTAETTCGLRMADGDRCGLPADHDAHNDRAFDYHHPFAPVTSPLAALRARIEAVPRYVVRSQGEPKCEERPDGNFVFLTDVLSALAEEPQ